MIVMAMTPIRSPKTVKMNFKMSITTAKLAMVMMMMMVIEQIYFREKTITASIHSTVLIVTKATVNRGQWLYF